MKLLTPIRQQLEQALSELKQEHTSLELELDLKGRQIAALEVLLATEGFPPLVLTPKPEDEQDNATERVREIIKGSGPAGVRPRDITRKLRELGVNVSSQFASNVLWRLKNKTEEIEKIGGRYAWKRKFLPPPSRAI